MKRINTTQRSPGIQIAVLLLLLSSCTSGEQETGIGRPLEVTAEIAAPVTRATDAHESDYDKRTFVARSISIRGHPQVVVLRFISIVTPEALRNGCPALEMVSPLLPKTRPIRLRFRLHSVG